MILKVFPKLGGVLVNLREVSINDAQDITHLLMNYNVSKHLWEVPNPYSIEDALDFIKGANSDFNSLKALHFAIEYKGKSKPRNAMKKTGEVNEYHKISRRYRKSLKYVLQSNSWFQGSINKGGFVCLCIAFTACYCYMICIWVTPSIRLLRSPG